MKDWSDLRILAAIVREGSLAGAVRSLGIHHVTAGRRLTVLERELGVKLIDRLPRAAVPTADGLEIAKLAGQTERFFGSVNPPAAPAVTLIEVSKLYGPDFLIEIEAVAAA